MGARTDFDHIFKLLLIGDFGAGKSSLLLCFTTDTFDDLSPTIGVDFKLKLLTMGGKWLKLTIWDRAKNNPKYTEVLMSRVVAGQERFRTLTSSYSRGAQGIILDLSNVWLKEVDLYSTNPDCIKTLVGNKVDKTWTDTERVVSKKEGIAMARQWGCLFLECSAKTRANVQLYFEELVQKILDTPSLLVDTQFKKNLLRPEASNEP